MSKARFRGLPSIDLDRVVGGATSAQSATITVKAGAMPSEVLRALRGQLHDSSLLDDADAATAHHTSPTSGLGDFGSHPVSPSHSPSHAPSQQHAPSQSSSHDSDSDGSSSHSGGGSRGGGSHGAASHSSASHGGGSHGGGHSSSARSNGDSAAHPASAHHGNAAASHARARNEDPTTSEEGTSGSGRSDSVPLPPERPANLGSGEPDPHASPSDPDNHASSDIDHQINQMVPLPDYPTQAPEIDTHGVTPQYTDEQLAQNRADTFAHFDDGVGLHNVDDQINQMVPLPDYPTQAPEIDTHGVTPQYTDDQLAQNRADTFAHFDDGAGQTANNDQVAHQIDSMVGTPDYPTEAPQIDTHDVQPQYTDDQLAQNRDETFANYEDAASPSAETTAPNNDAGLDTSTQSDEAFV